MEHPNYLSPRIGPRTVIVAALWVVGVSVATFQIDQGSLDTGPLAIRFALIGTFYGTIGWLYWLISLLTGTLTRSIARTVIALVGSYLLHLHTGETGWIRYLVYFAGLMISQSAIFFLLGIPVWRRGSLPSESLRRQFGIGEILAGTTGIALLLGIAIRYRPPIDPSEYWQVLIGVWVLFPIISAAGCIGILSRDPTRSAFAIFAALLLSAIGAMSLAYFDQTFRDSSSSYRWIFVLFYSMIAIGNLLMFSAFALAGRLDAAKNLQLAESRRESPTG